VRGIDPAILSRAVALVTLAADDEDLGKPTCTELQTIIAEHQVGPVVLGLCELVLGLCDCLGEATDTDPTYIRQRLALIAAEAQ